MDRDYQSRGSAATNSPLRHALYYPDVSSPTRYASPRTREYPVPPLHTAWHDIIDSLVSLGGSDGSSSYRSRVNGKGSAKVPPRINTGRGFLSHPPPSFLTVNSGVDHPTDISRMARNQPVITGQPATPPPREYRTLCVGHKWHQNADGFNPAGNSDSGSSSLVNPTSTLLQDLIKEQRATRGSRSRRTTMSDYAAGNGVASTPASTNSQDETASEKQRKINEALSAGLKQPREMGIREMDQVSPE